MPGTTLAVELVEFLAVAVQTILFTHDVYPPNLFERRRKWGILVYTARHPALLEYLRSVLADALPWIESGQLERVTVALTVPPAAAYYCQYHIDITVRAPSTALSSEQRSAANTVFAAHVATLLTQSAPPLPPAPLKKSPAADAADAAGGGSGGVVVADTAPAQADDDRFPEFVLLFHTAGVMTSNQWVPAACRPAAEKTAAETATLLVPLADSDPLFNMFTLRLTLQNNST